jgi:hypothetical protein
MFNKMLKTSREYKRLKIRKADCVILMLLAVYKNGNHLLSYLSFKVPYKKLYNQHIYFQPNASTF